MHTAHTHNTQNAHTQTVFVNMHMLHSEIHKQHSEIHNKQDTKQAMIVTRHMIMTRHRPRQGKTGMHGKCI
jgi:hypothetical protein